MEYINALPTGTRLEEYEIRDVLGHGGFGVTYLADDTHLNKPVALKEYLPRDFATRVAGGSVTPHSDAAATDYRWGLEGFLAKARILARFDHPHLNKVYRFFEANGTAYLVLEYIDGQTLSHLLSKYPTLPSGHLQRIIAEVLDGLEDVHAVGYVHRDIKPSNIMLRQDGSTVLVDFGAARSAVEQRSRSINSILTPGYAPIEQYGSSEDDVGPWSDLYALGMVAYRCLSGLGDAELQLHDAVTRARAQRKGDQDLTPAAEVGKGTYDTGFLAAIDWAIRVNEEDRPQTIAAWQEAFLGGNGATAPPPVPASSPHPTPAAAAAKKPPVLSPAGGFGLVSKAALAVVGAVVLGAGLWLLYPDLASMIGADSTDQSRPALRSAPPDPTTANALTDWEEAQKIDTPESYRQFIDLHPDSPLTKLAERKLAE